MVTRPRPSTRQKAATKRRIRRRTARRKWLKKQAKAGWRRLVKATRKAREAKRKAREAKPKPITRAGTKAVTKAPPPGAAWWAALVAYFRAQNLSDRANGKANDARNRANALDHQRSQRRSTFICYGHAIPQRFATAAELNAHLEIDHPEPVQHQRGKESPPIRNVAPKNNRPPGRTRNKTTRRGRTGSGDRGRVAAEKWAGEAMATLGDIGSARITSVSQIKETAAALEKIGLEIEEAVTGFQQNAQTSEEAPVDPGVLSQLDKAKEGAEQVRAGAVGFVSAFEDHYAEDIREAQAGERMNNKALTS